MFEVEGVTYSLKFNRRKHDLIERQTDASIMALFRETSGLFPVFVLQVMFVTALVEEPDSKPIKGQKAVDIFDNVLEENGYSATAQAVISKYKDDMGFMFR